MTTISPALETWFEANRDRADIHERLQSLLVHGLRTCLSSWPIGFCTPDSLLSLAECLPQRPSEFPPPALWKMARERPEGLKHEGLAILSFASQTAGFCPWFTSHPQLCPANWGNGPRIRDLRGVLCPDNAAKARVELNHMRPGDYLELWLDPGPPIENVPLSLIEAGHQVVERERRGSYWRLRIRCGPP